MNNHEWIEYAKENETVLTKLIKDWHPACATLGQRHMQRINRRMPITAQNAQSACDKVCEVIREEHTGAHPVEQFKDALEKKDISKIYTLLNSAWFGVPESTTCWDIRGFAEAVKLLEEVPESD